MRRAAVIADVGLALVLVETLVAVLAGAASELSWHELLDGFVVTNTALGLALAVSGYPIARQRPGNPIGWILLGGGVSYALSGAGYAALAWGTSPGDDDPGWRVLATFVNAGWPVAITIVIPLVLLLFPDGRPLSSRWRWVVGLTIVTGLLYEALAVTSPESTVTPLGIDGYLQVPALMQQRWLIAVASGVVLLVQILSLVSLGLRYRRGDSREREQVLWLLLAALVVIVSWIVDGLLNADSWFNIVVIALLPLAVMIAILRHQLLDIRLVVSRSVVYVVLTGLVVAAYIAIVAVTDRSIADRVPLGPPVLATLTVAALFNPVRLWLQKRVDRVVYGARRDPVRAVAEVSARVGEVEVGHLAGLSGLLESICDVMRIPSAAIVVDGAEVASYGHAGDEHTRLPLRLGGEVIGDLDVGHRRGEDHLDPADQRVLALLCSPLTVALRATALAEELAAARQSLVTAREEERRRLRRDLHDGIGPVLAGVTMKAEAARLLVESDPEQAGRIMAELRDQTTGAVDEIRRLVNELRPPALDVLGLTGALQEHAATLGAGQLTVRVVSSDRVPELPAAVEVALYRIATEALTNVVRHSDATTASVSIDRQEQSISLVVRDNGASANGSWRPGVGLTSMRERTTELGGTFTAGPCDGGGSVRVTVPLGGAL
jgi:two-component system, NarL family, sensor kinase